MFCKWCGGNLASSDKKCKRCGREVPALSDCGGFYDLVVPVKQEEAPVSTPAMPATPVTPAAQPPQVRRMAIPTPEAPKATKAAFSLTPMTLIAGCLLVCFLLMTILFAMTLSKANKQAEALEELRSQQDDGAKVSLAKQDVTFSVILSRYNFQPELDLGKYTDTAIMHYKQDGNTSRVNEVTFQLTKAKTDVTLKMDATERDGIYGIVVRWQLQEDVFGEIEELDCKWQYRFGSNGKWKNLSDNFTDTEDNRTELFLEAANLQELAEGQKGKLELRCQVTRTSESGGTQTLVIEGLRLTVDIEGIEPDSTTPTGPAATEPPLKPPFQPETTAPSTEPEETLPPIEYPTEPEETLPPLEYPTEPEETLPPIEYPTEPEETEPSTEPEATQPPEDMEGADDTES